MSDKDQQDEERREHGGEPNEEVGPLGCEVSAQECEIAAGDLDLEELIEASPREEIAEQLPIEVIALVASPEDGMPVPADEPKDLQPALAFTRHNCVCVEDDTEYVEVFLEELRRSGWDTASNVNVASHRLDARQKWDADRIGKENSRRSFTSDQVVVRFGRQWVQTSAGYLPVRPKRERCIYYKRQILLNEDAEDGEAGRQYICRNCTMRRSIGGAFLSVRDEAVLACDYRDPPDQETVEKYLDGPDRKRLNGTAHLEMVPFLGREVERP